MPPPFTSYTQAAGLVKAADHPISYEYRVAPPTRLIAHQAKTPDPETRRPGVSGRARGVDDPPPAGRGSMARRCISHGTRMPIRLHTVWRFVRISAQSKAPSEEGALVNLCKHGGKTDLMTNLLPSIVKTSSVTLEVTRLLAGSGIRRWAGIPMSSCAACLPQRSYSMSTRRSHCALGGPEYESLGNGRSDGSNGRRAEAYSEPPSEGRGSQAHALTLV
jgi:hypothetical protein